MADDRNKFLNDSGKAGLVIAAVAIAYFLISTFLSKSEGPRFLISALSLILWAGKLALCIWLMVKFLRTYAEANGMDRSRTFRFGMSVAFCSALVYSGFYLLYAMYIKPDMFADTFDMIAQSYSSYITSEELDRLTNMESSMPTISFFVNIVWCWLIGTIISAIASGRICGNDNPFE